MDTGGNQDGFDSEPSVGDGGGGIDEAAQASEHVGLVPPVDPPQTIYVARPLWSDRDRFLLLDAPQSKVWVDIGVLLLCLFAFEVVFGVMIAVAIGAGNATIVAERLSADGAIDDYESAISRKFLVPMLLVRATFSVFLIGLILRARGQRPLSVGVSPKRWGVNTLIGIGATPVVYGLISLAMVVLWLVKPSLLEQMYENADRLTALLPKLSLVSFAGVSVVVGVYEELIFRGFLMTRLRRGTGSWTLAVLLSTAIFTLLHAADQTPVALIAVTLLALAFSVLTIWRRSVIPAIVTHAIFDFTQFVGLYHSQGDAWT